MKRPLIYLILAIFFAGFVYLLERPDIFNRGDFSEQYLIKDYNAKDISEIEISQLINGIKFKLLDDKWMVSEFITPFKENLLKKEEREIPEEQWFEADEQKVKRALGAFGGMEEGVIVSKNPERYDLYNVRNTGLNIKLRDDNNKTILDLIIGKNGPDYDSNYIRKTDENEVHLIDQTLQGMFSIDVNDWKKQESK